jgi:hypothetical protein
VVVEAEFNGTNKTTLRSEWSCVLEKRKERIKKYKTNFLARAGIVRDVRFPRFIRLWLEAMVLYSPSLILNQLD